VFNFAQTQFLTMARIFPRVMSKPGSVRAGSL